MRPLTNKKKNDHQIDDSIKTILDKRKLLYIQEEDFSENSEDDSISFQSEEMPNENIRGKKIDFFV